MLLGQVLPPCRDFLCREFLLRWLDCTCNCSFGTAATYAAQRLPHKSLGAYHIISVTYSIGAHYGWGAEIPVLRPERRDGSSTEGVSCRYCSRHDPPGGKAGYLADPYELGVTWQCIAYTAGLPQSRNMHLGSSWMGKVAVCISSARRG